MTRKKVKLAFIDDVVARKASYKKRKKGLMKKMEEFTTLCGIEACAIIYNDFDPVQPEVWPSSYGVQNMLFKYNKYSQLDQCKNMLNQETYMRQSVNKAHENLEKVRKNNRTKEMSLLINQYLSQGNIFNNLSMADLNDLIWVINEKQHEINYKLSTLNKNLASTSQALPNQEVGEKQEEIAKDHVKEILEMNMNATQDISWYLNMINGGEDENQLMSFGEFNFVNK